MNSTSIDLVGIGNALLDFQVEVPFSFLEKHGFTRGSMTLVDAEFQHKILADVQATVGHQSVRRASGGCAANTLAGFTNYGGRGFFVGKVADDELGSSYARDLEQNKVQHQLAPGSTDRTGSCLALITPDAERTMLTHLGIATHLDESDIDAEKIKASKVIYIEGYLWDSLTARAASRKAMKIAKEAGKKVSLTYSDSFCVDRHFNDFIALAKNDLDILFCNQDEAIRATKAKNIDDAFREMKTWCDIVCVTTGARCDFLVFMANSARCLLRRIRLFSRSSLVARRRIPARLYAARERPDLKRGAPTQALR